MGLFSVSEEEKARREEIKKCNLARQEETEFNASPIGRAQQAYKDGLGYYQTSFDLEGVGRNTLNILSHSMNTQIKQTSDPVGAILTAIEKEGWDLIQAGFTFRQTHQDSRDKLLASGQQVAITGQTVGLYLFRRKP
ncbi:hypothetical protein CVV43_03695 [Candidatus Saccharibacteria bacterium HGW-Saccharibacteria-1]|jgi:hypothetical protein|nr:MAG: hypothetical protein CVV43_03695 [Candidatus Saccharibacteria bacterium HGW-Saccharibacteria-1]